MSRATKILTYIYCVISLLSVIACYASFVFLLSSYDWIQEHSDMLTGLLESWDNDLVFNVRATKNPGYLETNDFYFTTWNGRWPGVMQGCQCPEISDPNLPLRVEGFLQRPCTNFEMASYNCTQVSAFEAVNLTNWITPKYFPIQFNVVRVRNTSYRATLNNMNDDGSCKDGFYNCGNKTSKGGGYCISTQLECPINDMKPEKGDFKRVSIFEPLDIYYSSSEGTTPISDLYISEEFLCFNRQKTSYSLNATLFPLLLGGQQDCINDTQAWWLTEQPQKAIFDMNNIPYSDIPGFTISENATYRLFAARAPEWSRTCKNKIVQFDQALQTYLTLPQTYTSLYDLSVLCVTVALFSYTFQWLGVYSANLWLYILPFLFRAAFWVLQIPQFTTTFSPVQTLTTLFLSVESEDCSNSSTNAIFTTLGNSIVAGMQKQNSNVVTAHFIGFGLEVVALGLAVAITILRRKLEQQQLNETLEKAANLPKSEPLESKEQKVDSPSEPS